MGVVFVETTKNIKNEGAVQDRFTQDFQSVRHTLHLVAIIRDGEIALNKGSKLGIEDDGVSFFIADELLFEIKPNRP